jgi:hypothetical protein
LQQILLLEPGWGLRDPRFVETSGERDGRVHTTRDPFDALQQPYNLFKTATTKELAFTQIFESTDTLN